MEKVNLGYELDSTQLTITGPASELGVLPESDFFNLRESGADTSSFLPLPDGLSGWTNAIYQGGDILMGVDGDNMFIIAETDKDGLALYHYERDENNSTGYRLSFSLPKRVINTERKVQRMNIQDYAASRGEARNAALNQLNLDAQVNAPAVAGAGVGSGASIDRICAEATSYGYVLGYIMGSGPATSFTLGTEKNDAGETFRTIQARQSKPSGLKAVLLGLPRSCVMNGENLASPTEIERGKVTFDSSNHEMMYLALDKDAAIAYIHAFGDKLPEYAPAVSNRSSQWTPQMIADENPEVSYVFVRATEDNRENAKSPFRFSLRSSSARRSLFSEHNVVCLRAQEHVSIDAKNEEQEFVVNESAFGGWRYRGVRGEDGNARMSEVALNKCAEQIWSQTYKTTDADGNPIDFESFNSVYTCKPGTVTPKGRTIEGRQPIRYYPWYATGELRKTVGMKNVTEIVRRKCVPSKGKYGERMQSTNITLKANTNHPLFRQYNQFIDMVEELGAMTRETIMGYGERKKSAKGGSKNELTPDQYRAISDFIKSKNTTDAIRAAQKSVASKEAIRSRGNAAE